MDYVLVSGRKPYYKFINVDYLAKPWSGDLAALSLRAAFPMNEIRETDVGTKFAVESTIHFLRLMKILPEGEQFPEQWEFLRVRRATLKSKKQSWHGYDKQIWNEAVKLVASQSPKYKSRDIDICAALLEVHGKLHVQTDLNIMLQTVNAPMLVKMMLIWYQSRTKVDLKQR